MKAIWKNKIIAQSDNTIVIEGNHYFPPTDVKKEYLEASNTHSTCPWKGKASYYTLNVDGERNRDAAWFYPNPNEAAKEIKEYIAFWKGVTIAK